MRPHTVAKEAKRRALFDRRFGRVEPETVKARISAMKRFRRWLRDEPEWEEEVWHNPF